MPQFRKDPIIGRWVIISIERAKRPMDYTSQPRVKPAGMCPFCPGNEDKTPPEVLAYREPGKSKDSEGWWLRVVPNKYPALRVEGQVERMGDGMYDTMNGIGAHEVIIESPEHESSFGTYSQRQVEEIIWAYRDRAIELKKDRRFRYVLIFKNHGRESGASIEHPHTQLIAMPIVPKRVNEEMNGSERYYRFKERCIFCDIIRQETMTANRIIDENEEFIAICPFASRFPFETWILPKKHQSHFDKLERHQVVLMGQMMSTTLGKIERTLSDPPYNFMIHTSPTNETSTPSYHWHIEIIPKLTHVAGFEWGTGFYINPTPPEQAAHFLREETNIPLANGETESTIVTLSV